jgi:hypothetical protein
VRLPAPPEPGRVVPIAHVRPTGRALKPPRWVFCGFPMGSGSIVRRPGDGTRRTPARGPGRLGRPQQGAAPTPRGVSGTGPDALPGSSGEPMVDDRPRPHRTVRDPADRRGHAPAGEISGDGGRGDPRPGGRRRQRRGAGSPRARGPQSDRDIGPPFPLPRRCPCPVDQRLCSWAGRLRVICA